MAKATLLSTTPSKRCIYLLSDGSTLQCNILKSNYPLVDTTEDTLSKIIDWRNFINYISRDATYCPKSSLILSSIAEFRELILNKDNRIWEIGPLTFDQSFIAN